MYQLVLRNSETGNEIPLADLHAAMTQLEKLDSPPDPYAGADLLVQAGNTYEDQLRQLPDGAKVVFFPGLHREPITHLPNGAHLHFAKGAVLSAWRPFPEPAIMAQDLYFMPYTGVPGTTYHRSKSTQPTERHKYLSQPHNFAIENEDGTYTRLVQVMSADELRDRRSKGIKAFFIPGTPGLKPEHVYFNVTEDESYSLCYAAYPSMFAVAEDATVKITGEMVIDGSANTAKQGAFEFSGKMDVEHLVVRNAKTVAILFAGAGHTVGTLVSEDAGQMGYWGSLVNTTVERMLNIRSNQYDGFDEKWEAVLKFERSDGAKIFWYEAIDCGGVGLWMDIYNRNMRFFYVKIRNVVKAGIMLENGATNIVIDEYDIEEVAKGGPNEVSAGLQIQAKVLDCKLLKGRITGAWEAARYKKTTDSRGNSGRNEFGPIETLLPFNVYGDINVMPDTFAVGIDVQNIR